MTQGLDNLLSAIGAMTAWTTIDEGDRRLLGIMLTTETTAERDALIKGLISLAGGLLVMRHAETGTEPRDTLQSMACFAITRSATQGGH